MFLDRAASEAFLKENAVPEGHEVVSRRIHLELLKTIGAWDHLAQVDRDAMIAADGNWDWSLINQVVLCIEPVRLLRWILRIDFYLPLVGQQLQVDFKLAKELISAPNKAVDGSALATVPMLETGRDAARNFVLRCTAELIARGLLEADNEEIKKWATEAAASIGGNQSEDFLIDKHLVSEAPEEQLRWAATLSSRRAQFLKWAIAVMEGNVTIDDQFAAIC